MDTELQILQEILGAFGEMMRSLSASLGVTPWLLEVLIFLLIALTWLEANRLSLKEGRRYQIARHFQRNSPLYPKDEESLRRYRG